MKGEKRGIMKEEKKDRRRKRERAEKEEKKKNIDMSVVCSDLSGPGVYSK